MVQLTARKSMAYANRRLSAGDSFTANRRDARILVAIGKALGDGVEAPAPKRAPAPSDLQTLREQYQAKFGKRPFNGWTEAQLREKLAEG